MELSNILFPLFSFSCSFPDPFTSLQITEKCIRLTGKSLQDVISEWIEKWNDGIISNYWSIFTIELKVLVRSEVLYCNHMPRSKMAVSNAGLLVPWRVTTSLETFSQCLVSTPICFYKQIYDSSFFPFQIRRCFDWITLIWLLVGHTFAGEFSTSGSCLVCLKGNLPVVCFVCSTFFSR